MLMTSALVEFDNSTSLQRVFFVTCSVFIFFEGLCMEI